MKDRIYGSVELSERLEPSILQNAEVIALHNKERILIRYHVLKDFPVRNGTYDVDDETFAEALINKYFGEN